MVSWTQYQGSAQEWDEYVGTLSGNFYQTYGWGEVRRVAGWHPLRLVARCETQVAAVASVLFKRRFGIAVCWIPGGPLGSSGLLNASFRKALGDALGTKLFYCRLSLLRIDAGDERDILASSGWTRPKTTMTSGLSMSYLLSDDQPTRLKLASSNWRHNLKRANKYNLRVEHWIRPDHEAISRLYREMEALKSLPMQHSAQELKSIFENCQKEILVYRCLNSDGHLLAIRAAGLSAVKAVDLLAVAGSEARKVYASHATLWALLNHCNELGLQEYDLGGVDPTGNKGVFDFKQGTGATLIEYLGEWEWSAVPGLSTAVNWQVARSRA